MPVLAAKGWRVRASGREPSRCPPGCEFVAADLLTTETLDSLVAGVDAIVHLAARAQVMRDSAHDPHAEFRRANVEPSARLAAAATRNGVRQLVFLSTIKVNGEATVQAPFTESDPPHPEDPYAVSKLEAERVLSEQSVIGGLPVTLLRPPLIYGPGVKGNFLRLMRLIERGVPLPLGSVRNRRSLIYVGNLCDAIVAALARPAPGVRIYLISDREDLSTPELVRRMAAALGRPARLLHVPVGLMRLAAIATGYESELRRLTESLVVDSSRIGRELGWTPPVSVDEGLAETIRTPRPNAGGSAADTR